MRESFAGFPAFALNVPRVVLARTGYFPAFFKALLATAVRTPIISLPPLSSPWRIEVFGIANPAALGAVGNVSLRVMVGGAVIGTAVLTTDDAVGVTSIAANTPFLWSLSGSRGGDGRLSVVGLTCGGVVDIGGTVMKTIPTLDYTSTQTAADGPYDLEILPLGNSAAFTLDGVYVFEYPSPLEGWT